MDPGRICPGKYLALRTVYLVVTCILFVFDIGPVLDEDGNPQIPKIELDNTTVRYVSLEPSVHIAADVDRHNARAPKTFECTIKPRSEEAIKLVKETRDRTNC